MSSSSELLSYRQSSRDHLAQRVHGGLLRQLWATLNSWGQRAYQRKQLLRLNADQLKDIGISAADAYREGNKPFWRR